MWTFKTRAAGGRLGGGLDKLVQAAVQVRSEQDIQVFVNR